MDVAYSDNAEAIIEDAHRDRRSLIRATQERSNGTLLNAHKKAQ
jgi:hypothetical protein